MHWYAVKAKHHQEGHAVLSLQRLGVETFFPLLQRSRVIRRKRQTTTGPLFPGYLFAKFNFQTHHRAVSYAHGVGKIVEFGIIPAIVDEEIITAIEDRIQGGYVTVPTQSFTRGQAVRITEGYLQGLHAIFERDMSDQERVVLLVQALSYQARVIVSSQHVVNL
jgi:transcriptional antiterminator RfaH